MESKELKVIVEKAKVVISAAGLPYLDRVIIMGSPIDAKWLLKNLFYCYV